MRPFTAGIGRWGALAAILMIAGGAVAWWPMSARRSPAAAVGIHWPTIHRARPIDQMQTRDEQRLAEPAGLDRQSPMMVFQNRRYRRTGTLRLVVTAYCPGECCCGDDADGVTASGRRVSANGMRMVAADTKLLPFGTLVSVPGYQQGQPVPVWDRGGKIKGYRLDVLMPTHAQARAWGRRLLDVPIWQPMASSSE